MRRFQAYVCAVAWRIISEHLELQKLLPLGFVLLNCLFTRKHFNKFSLRMIASIVHSLRMPVNAPCVACAKKVNISKCTATDSIYLKGNFTFFVRHDLKNYDFPLFKTLKNHLKLKMIKEEEKVHLNSIKKRIKIKTIKSFHLFLMTFLYNLFKKNTIS